MNIKSIITLLAFLLWSWYSWNWLKEKQQECGCSISTAAASRLNHLPENHEMLVYQTFDHQKHQLTSKTNVHEVNQPNNTHSRFNN